MVAWILVSVLAVALAVVIARLVMVNREEENENFQFVRLMVKVTKVNSENKVLRDYCKELEKKVKKLEKGKK